MKNNYINQFQRDIMVGFEEIDFYKKELEMEKERVLKQEQSILSIGDKADSYIESLYNADCFNNERELLKNRSFKDFIAGANEMLPIIKELGEVLKLLIIDCMANDFNEHWDSFKNADTTLDKYKNYIQ
jgi:hypothetical protein